jgi:hypothetical protein
MYQRDDVVATLWRQGQRFAQGFNEAAEAAFEADELRCLGYHVHPRIHGEHRDLFLRAAFEEGLLFHPAGFNVSTAHTDEIVDETLAACRRAMETTAAMVALA